MQYKQKTSEEFKKFLYDGSLNRGLINNVVSLFTKISDYEMEIDKPLQSWDKQNVIDFFATKNKSRGYNALQTKINAAKELFRFFELDENMIDITELKKVALESDDRYFKIDEIIEFCEQNLVNAQDKALVMLLFNGIMGTKYQEICDLKIEQIVGNKIELKDRVVIVDDYTAEVLEEAKKQRFYYKYLNDNANGSTNDYYTLNLNNPYLFRPKRTSLNNKGLDAFKSAGIQRRVMFLSNFFGTRITGKSLSISGLMHKLFLIEKEMIEENNGESITVSFIRTWAKDNGYKAQPYELYRYYNMKYEDDLQKLHNIQINKSL